MNQVFGERSRYLILNDYIARILSLVVLACLFYLVYWYWDTIVFHKTGVSAIVLTIFFLFFFFWVKKNGEEQIGIFARFKQGRYGEYEVCDELVKLPEEFFVFQDVKIPGYWGNIDFVVLGPTGVFALEVKSHKGKIGFDGRRLTRYGSVILGKDFLQQAKGEALRLHEYLVGVVGKEFFVEPVLVFSSNRASVRFGFQKQNNVYVIGKGYLHELITGGKGHLSPQDVEVLKSELMKLVRLPKK